MSLDWKDSSSYSRGEERLSYPKAAEAYAGRVRAAVARDHIHAKGEWVMHCTAFGYDTYRLGVAHDGPASFERAKHAAEEIIRERVLEAARAFGVDQ